MSFSRKKWWPSVYHLLTSLIAEMQQLVHGCPSTTGDDTSNVLWRELTPLADIGHKLTLFVGNYVPTLVSNLQFYKQKLMNIGGVALIDPTK